MDLGKDLLGAHISAAGGAWRALLGGESIGATMIQLFTANQRQWHPAGLEQETIGLFHATRDRMGMGRVMSHASYLINLGSPDEGGRAKSCRAFREEIGRCEALGVDYLTFHPGAALQGSREACLERIVQGLLSMDSLLQRGNLRLLVETMAGQGSVVGSRFEEIGFLVRACADKIPFGVCMDTCHIFAAGYDIRDVAGWERTLDEFDEKVGMSHLYAFHLNDSLHDLGSGRDRHAPLGKGAVGWDAFAYLMRSPRTAHLPKCLETPGGMPIWKKEMELLRSFRDEDDV